ncbi:App1 family protein [Foetidibacter luteolus]|uniref:App1 family protein n=1 Tax=Foetidibacter luteolus TaxID=2608880 RepID=UPI00129AAE0D|nr:phosphatase domain-containing protein [Foetidibacter luteolus]
MTKLNPKNTATHFVKVYHGFGHAHNMQAFGHVFKQKIHYSTNAGDGFLQSVSQLMRLFFVQPLAGVRVRLTWENQQFESVTESDGFFRFEWQSENSVPAGWHRVTISSLDEEGKPVASGEGMVFIPHITQYGIISDIDDTVMVSHSATVFKRLRELLTRNAFSRKVFADSARLYNLLGLAQTTADTPNPFFYVSSSEWNLYDYLLQVFRHNKLPEGALLLNQVKRWFELWKTGKTKHEGKLLRIVRILEAFPNQQFILLGDNSQSDPAIYQSITEKYQGRIFAVYIRNVHPEKITVTSQILNGIQQTGVHALLFNSSLEAIEHVDKIGLSA